MSAEVFNSNGAVASISLQPIDLAHEPRFRLGEMEVTPALREIAAPDGTRQTLEPRVMQVLIALARAKGSIVTRDELTRTCWHGMVVGEDSINRAVSLLRRVSEGIGRGDFRIQTIAKVGYRLVLLQQGVYQTTRDSGAAPEASVPARRRQLVWAAVAVLLSVIGVFAVRQAAPEGLAYSVSVEPYESAGVPAGLEDELLSALYRRGVPTAGGQVRLTLTGSIEHGNGDIHVHTRLVSPNSREVVWSGDTRLSTTDPAAIAAGAAVIGVVMQCTLAFANEADRALSLESLSRFARTCHLMIGGEPEEGVRVARQLTRASPGFAGGWFALANHALALYLRWPGEVVSLREEALAAAEQLVALHPRAQEGYIYKALAMDPEQTVDRERLLLQAAGLEPIFVDVGQAYLGDFLLQGGRLEESYQSYRRQVQQNPDIAINHVRVFFAAAATDRWPIAEDALGRARQLGTTSMPLLLWRMAVWKGDWADAEQLIPFEHPAQVEAGMATYGALASGDPTRKEAAARLVLALPADCCVPLRIEMLTQLGHYTEALALFDEFEAGRSPGRRPGNVGLFLWDPVLRPLWQEQGIEPFLRRNGWISYWHASRSRPDICGQERPPSLCHLLGP